MNKLFRPPFFLAATALALAFGFAPSSQAQSSWLGGGTTNNWSDPGNWDNYPSSNVDLIFATQNLRTTNSNDFAPGLSINSVTFNSTAAAFTLQGNPIGFFSGTNSITNNSSNLQTLDFNAPIKVDTNLTIDAASGNIQINNGFTLENFSNAGGNLIFDGDFNTTVSGVIAQDALRSNITKNGTGTLRLNGNNDYRGGTTINDGTLIVGNINALGTQEQNIFATAHNDVLLVGGTLQTPEGMPLIFRAPDNYTQTGGTLRIQIGGINPGVNADQMQVGRDANLSSELFVHRINNFMPFAGERVTIITTNNGTVMDFGGTTPGTVNGTFDTVNTDFPGLIQPHAEYFTDHVDIHFELSAFTSVSGLTRNQFCVAENLDAAADLGNNSEAAALLVRFVGNIAPADLPAAFDLLAPEELSSIYEISFSHAILESANFQHRLSDIRLGVTGYCQLGEAVVETKDAKDGKTVVDKNGPVVETCPDKRWGVFATGYGQAVQVDDDANAHGYEISTGGFTTGADYRISDHFAIGVGGGYAHSNTQIGGDLDVSTAYAGVYATAFAGGFYVDATANGGWSDIDTSRFGLGGTETGNTDGAEFNGLIGVGYDWKHNCWTLGAFGNFQYTYVEFNSFDESDTTLAPLHFPDQNQTAEHSRLGLKLAYDSGKGNTIWRPEVRVAWQHEFGDTDYAIDWSFLNISDNHICSVFGPQTGDDSALIDAGFSLIFGRCHNVSAYVFYNGNVGRDSYSRHGATGGLRVNF